jgi:hypothetical protein
MLFYKSNVWVHSWEAISSAEISATPVASLWGILLVSWSMASCSIDVQIKEPSSRLWSWMDTSVAQYWSTLLAIRVPCQPASNVIETLFLIPFLTHSRYLLSVRKFYVRIIQCAPRFWPNPGSKITEAEGVTTYLQAAHSSTSKPPHQQN